MKTQKIRLLEITAIITLIQLFTIFNAWSQGCMKTKIYETGITINTMNTSSGLGFLIENSVFLKCNRNELSGGIVYQKGYNKISSYIVQYKHYVIDNNRINLHFYYSYMNSKNANLRSELNYIFHKFEFEEVKEFEKFDIREHFAGFGIQVQLLNNLFLDSKIGFGGYFSDVINEDTRNKNIIYHEDNAFGLQLSAGLRYKLRVNNQKTRWP